MMRKTLSSVFDGLQQRYIYVCVHVCVIKCASLQENYVFFANEKMYPLMTNTT